MRVQCTRTKQLRAPLTTTLGHPKSVQCNFNSFAFNYESDYIEGYWFKPKLCCFVFYFTFISRASRFFIFVTHAHSTQMSTFYALLIQLCAVKSACISMVAVKIYSSCFYTKILTPRVVDFVSQLCLFFVSFLALFFLIVHVCTHLSLSCDYYTVLPLTFYYYY